MIHALQHIGFGVEDLRRSHSFYRGFLGFKLPLNDHEAPFPEMEPLFGEVVRMHIVMAMNPQGGGVIEIARHTSSQPRKRETPPRWGDIGFLDASFRAFALPIVKERLERKGLRFLSPILEQEADDGSLRWRYVYFRDPDGMLLRLVELPGDGRPLVAGLIGVTVGVSDLERSVAFYRDVLGFQEVLRREGEVPEPQEVTGGGRRFKVAVLRRPDDPSGPFPTLYGGMIRLVEGLDYRGEPLFQGRRWGDVGLMEVALDVTELEATVEEARKKGATLVLPPTRLDMGTGSVGRFAYLADPDGNWVELLEVEKVFWLPPRIVSQILIPLVRACLR